MMNIKMVRMVHRKLFYNTELKMCDSKSELWRKTENLEGSEISKFGFEVQDWTFEGCSKSQITLKHIGTPSATIPIQFTCMPQTVAQN